MLFSSGLAYGLIPKYSCGNGADGKPLPACSKVAAGDPCCTKASNMGWRYLLLTTGFTCFSIFLLRFLVFRFQESPKFLLSRGQDKKAVEVLHSIARFNKRESTITMEVFATLTDEGLPNGTPRTDSQILAAGTKELKRSLGHKAKAELARYKVLFSTTTMARLTILVWITYMFDYWGFSIAGKIGVEGSYQFPADIHTRIFITENSTRKEQRHQRFFKGDLSKFYHHLHVRHPRGSLRGPNVQSTSSRSQMGHGRIFCLDGYFSLSLRYCQYRGI